MPVLITFKLCDLSNINAEFSFLFFLEYCVSLLHILIHLSNLIIFFHFQFSLLKNWSLHRVRKKFFKH